jgi:hypothetical protein
MGRHWYSRVKVRCARCGWRGKRTTFWSRKPCPNCKGRCMVDPLGTEGYTIEKFMDDLTSQQTPREPTP